jgi:hypothetical protein
MGEIGFMNKKNSILSYYKEGSRRGNISILKGKNNNYQIIIDWDDPQYNSTMLFSGELQECLDFSISRFGISKQTMNSFYNKYF